MRDEIDAAPLERVPPHSVEAEQGVLGALLQDNGCVAVVGDILDADSFYCWEHRAIFGAVMDLLKSSQPADIVTVFEKLGADAVAEMGGLAFLNDLAQCVATPRNARSYAEIVAEKASERALIAGSAEVDRISWAGEVPLGTRMEMIAGVLARVEQQRKGPARRVPLLGLQALRDSSAAVRWSVKHVIPAASIGMLFGGSGTFKSFIALDLALHVVHGLPWMGRMTTPGPVLYIAAEGGAGLWGRIDAWHRARNLRWQDAQLYVVPAAVDLTVDAWRVVDAAQSVGVRPCMVIVDTLSQTYAGEENSANEMAAYLREIGMRFRQLWGCSVVLVHHTGHAATERPRGSSAIRANIDFLLSCFRDEKQMLCTLGCVKQKDGELFKDAVFQLTSVKLGLDHDGDEVTSLVARHVSGDEAVMQARQDEQQSGRGDRQQQLMSLVTGGMFERDLRKGFYGLMGAEVSIEAKKIAFYRARKAAVAAGQIYLGEGQVFVVQKGGT